MDRLELSFESGHKSLSVRRFSIREALSTPFEVSVFARSPLPDLDLEPFLSRGATLTLRSGVAHVLHGERSFAGVVSHMEQVRVEEPTAGSRPLSTYHLRIVPRLRLLERRTRSRIFQRQSLLEVVRSALDEWGIKPIEKLSKTYPKLDYVVQYEETDLAFVSRLLERAGITYLFAFGGGKAGELTLDDHPHDAAPRPPIRCVDNPNQSGEKEFVTAVRLAQQVRPGRFTIRDFDLRRRLDRPVVGEAKPASPPEDFYEQYRYLPGSTLAIDPGDGDASTPFADQRGKVRSVEAHGAALAERSLASARQGRRRLAFHTNCIDLAPGVAFTVDGHPRADVGKPVLVTELTLDGSPDGAWDHEGHGEAADIGALDRGSRRHEPHLLALYGYKNNLCPHGIARDPRDLAYFLSEQWGKPTQEWDKPKEKPKDIADLTGIVAFVNAVDEQDVPCHVALWNKTEAIGRAYFHCEKVLLWKLE
jgi:type VI secretion system secreted protein VgrG